MKRERPVNHGGAARKGAAQAVVTSPRSRPRTPLARNRSKVEKAQFIHGAPATMLQAPKRTYIVRKLAHCDAPGRPLADVALDMVDRMVASSLKKKEPWALCPDDPDDVRQMCLTLAARRQAAAPRRVHCRARP